MVNSSTNINKMNKLLSFQLMKQKRTTTNVWIFVCFLFYHTITKQSTTLNNQWLKRKSDAGMKKTLRFIFSFRMWIFYKQRQSLQLYNCFYQRMTAFNKTSGCLSRVFVLCLNFISNHQFSKTSSASFQNMVGLSSLSNNTDYIKFFVWVTAKPTFF